MFGQQPPQLIDQCRALAHQAPARPMHRELSLLLGVLHRHKAHARALHRLADRLGIVAVVLVILAIGLHELRRHQAHRVPQGRELSRPVVAAGAGLHADQAGL